MRLILASQSPRRKELLGQITGNFSVEVSRIEERRDPAWTAEELPRQLALQKALDVSSRSASDLVIGADTIVSLDGVVLGKPRDEAHAADMLRMLSSRTHRVYTGVAFCRDKKELSSFVQCTEVDFYPLTEEQIRRYLKTGEPFDKAGAYGIQGKGSLFVKELRGDYFNVVGFPVARVARELESLSCADGFPAWI